MPRLGKRNSQFWLWVFLISVAGLNPAWAQIGDPSQDPTHISDMATLEPACPLPGEQVILADPGPFVPGTKLTISGDRVEVIVSAEGDAVFTLPTDVAPGLLAISAKLPDRTVLSVPLSICTVLGGDPSSPGIDAIYDLDAGLPPLESEIEVDGAGMPVSRTEVEAVFAPSATVGEIDQLIQSIDGRILKMFAGVYGVVIRIPDPGSLENLDAIVSQLNGDPLTRFVSPDVSIVSPGEDHATNQDVIPVEVHYRATANPNDPPRTTGNVHTVILSVDGMEVGRFDNPPQVKEGGHVFDLNLTPYPEGTIAVQACSYQGAIQANHATCAETEVLIDRTPPVLSATTTPEPNANGWNNTDTTVAFSATDALSGVAEVDPLSVDLMNEGQGQDVNGTARDRAGNVAMLTVTVNIDKTAPTIASSADPMPNANGWNNSDVTVGFSCMDALSGVASCTDPTLFGTQGAGQLVTGTAVDLAGNTAVLNHTVNIDMTPPSVAITVPADGTKLHTPEIKATGTASDALSGIAEVICDGFAAALTESAFQCPPTMLNEGLNAIGVQAMDLAGNTAMASTTITFALLPTVTISAPANLSFVNISPTTVTGTVDNLTATVAVNSIPAAVVNGAFSVAIPLAEGPNTVTASAVTATGAVGSTSVQVTLDTTPPRVTITSPPNMFETTDDSIAVAGSVNDLVVGTVNDQQARVSVNGVPADVANRAFLVGEVPLAVGANVIQAVGTDRVGNAATTQITVVREVPTPEGRIRLVSGNKQSGMIGTLLPDPLIIELTDATEAPIPGETVIFKVIRNDGMVASDGPLATTVIGMTDAQGRAEVQWKLGNRAGAGSNAVEAYVVGVKGTALFTATGTQGPAGKIVVDTGNDQIGVVSQRLPKPFIVVVVDTGDNRLKDVPVTYTVIEGGGSFDGEPSFTVKTDSDGRAAATLTLGPLEGQANNVVEVDFPGNETFQATFKASGLASGDPEDTTISGLVLNNSNVPIPGVTVRAELTDVLEAQSGQLETVASVQTDEQGQFMIPQAPVGFVKLFVDGGTATLPGDYPSLEYDMVTVAGQDNTVGMPIFLLPLNKDDEVCVTATDGGGTLTLPEAPGFSLSFGPGQVKFPGGSKSGCVGVTVVHGDKVPMVPGFGQQPRFIVTIQPTGAVFNPPAPITLPNVDGLPPGAVTEMYSFDHDIGSFVAIGTGTVSEDGLVIASDPGVGVLKAGWHCGGDPAANGSVADCPDCKICRSNTCVPDNSQNGSNPRDPMTCCFEGEKIAKYGQTVGILFPGPLETKCPQRTQHASRLHDVDGCSNPITPSVKDDPMQLLPYPYGLLNQAPTAFGQPIGVIPNPGAAGPLPCNQHDICYQTCAAPGASLSSTREVCDDAMKTRMDNVCSAAYPSTCPSTLSTLQCASYFLQRLDCFTYSATYWGVLRTAGFFAAYKDRQEQYCQCCP